MSPILNYVDFIQLLEQKIEPQIIQGPKGDPYQYKKEGEKFFFAKKNKQDWQSANKPEAIKSISQMFINTAQNKAPISGVGGKVSTPEIPGDAQKSSIKPSPTGAEKLGNLTYLLNKNGTLNFMTSTSPDGKTGFYPGEFRFYAQKEGINVVKYKQFKVLEPFVEKESKNPSQKSSYLSFHGVPFKNTNADITRYCAENSSKKNFEEFIKNPTDKKFSSGLNKWIIKLGQGWNKFNSFDLFLEYSQNKS